MDEKAAINYIFYLKSSDKLNAMFFLLSDLFRLVNIVLMPVSVADLQTIDRSKKHQIIVFRNDFQSAQAFLDVRKSYLDFAMNRGHVTVFDISSFSQMENSSKLQTQKYYFYFPLPANLKQFVVTVAAEYFKNKKTVEDWPGGRKSKLPTNINYENKNK